MIEGSFRKTAGSLDGGELLLMGFVGLFLEIEFVEQGKSRVWEYIEASQEVNFVF